MTKLEGMANDAYCASSSFVPSASFVIQHSYFVILRSPGAKRELTK